MLFEGQRRALYSALGHTATSYAEPAYAEMLRGATRWVLKLEGDACGFAPANGKK